MPRTMQDNSTLYRIKVVREDTSYRLVEYQGPYSTRGTALAQATRERKLANSRWRASSVTTVTIESIIGEWQED